MQGATNILTDKTKYATFIAHQLWFVVKRVVVAATTSSPHTVAAAASVAILTFVWSIATVFAYPIAATQLFLGSLCIDARLA